MCIRDSIAYDRNGNFIVTSFQPGSYTVNQSDGSAKIARISEVPEAVSLSDWSLSLTLYQANEEFSSGNAVSYTHLDVYKRQPWGQSSTTVYVVTDSEGNDITASCTVLKEGDIASAVTQADGDYYYELQKVMRTDTYGINIPKTDSQGNLYYEDENGRRFMDDWQYLYEVSAADLQAAVSYTHLDVYKRQGSGNRCLCWC